MRTERVVFGVPTEGHTGPEALQSLRLMCFHHGVMQGRGDAEGSEVRYEFLDGTSGRMFTPMAREKLAIQAIESGADYLFMVDDDMVAPFDLYERLRRHSVDVVAALAFTRNPPFLAVLYETASGWDPVLKRGYYLTNWIRNWPRNKLVECDAVGFGAVLIKTAILKKMKPPYFMCSSGTGEDIWFCIRAKKEADARIFMDTSTEIGHIGSPVIIDSKMHDEANDPATSEKLYAIYKKYGVYDVSHWEPKVEEGKPVVLAL